MVKDLNRRLKALAAERGVTFAHYYTPFATANGAFDPHFTNDGLQPTRAGYAMMEPWYSGR